MKRITIAVLLGVAFLAFASSASAQTCQPDGRAIFGPTTNEFDYVANGSPANGDCWSMFNATISTITCEDYPRWIANTFEFNYGGDITQTFTIPATDTSY